MNSDAIRLEDFIQAVQSQLDNAQAAMAVKARNQNLPLTFAIKDINLDLRAHVEFTDSEIRIRPAAAGEKEVSAFHLVFTAITRPAIEENAITFSTDDDQPLEDLGDARVPGGARGGCDRWLAGHTPPSRCTSRAFCAWRRFSASSHTHDRGPSTSSASTSRPR